MHPLFIVVAVAGAYLLGRKKGEAEAPVAAPTGELPEPEPEVVAEEDWDALPYSVEVYPAGAVTDFAPPAEGAIVAAPDCSVIAVADGWWESAIAAIPEGAKDPVGVVVKTWVPACVGADTVAHQLLRAEIMDRLKVSGAQAIVINPHLDVFTHFPTKPPAPPRPRRFLGLLRGRPRRKLSALPRRR